MALFWILLGPSTCRSSLVWSVSSPDPWQGVSAPSDSTIEKPLSSVGSAGKCPGWAPGYQSERDKWYHGSRTPGVPGGLSKVKFSGQYSNNMIRLMLTHKRAGLIDCRVISSLSHRRGPSVYVVRKEMVWLEVGIGMVRDAREVGETWAAPRNQTVFYARRRTKLPISG